MRLCSIASGSSGNSIYVGNDDTHILVDAGISTKRIVAGLNELTVSPQDLSGILITHEHIDHIGGLGVFLRKYGIPVYATAGTIKGIKKCDKLGEFDYSLLNEIRIDEEFNMNDIKVRPFKTSHDANESCGFVMDDKKARVAVATDLGVYTEYTIEALSNLDALLLEANHDIRMLEVGSYPYYLKQRILGERGHLSNEASGRLLSKLLHDNFKEVLLGHISKENNYEKLAYETVKSEVTVADCKYSGGDFPIGIAGRDGLSKVVTV